MSLTTTTTTTTTIKCAIESILIYANLFRLYHSLPLGMSWDCAACPRPHRLALLARGTVGNPTSGSAVGDINHWAIYLAFKHPLDFGILNMYSSLYACKTYNKPHKSICFWDKAHFVSHWVSGRATWVNIKYSKYQHSSPSLSSSHDGNDMKDCTLQVTGYRKFCF